MDRCLKFFGWFWISLLIPASVCAFVPSETFAPIVSAVMPSVVTILTGSETIQIPDETTRVEQTLENRRIGSGFILDTDGHILTNNHVIGQSDYIYVEFADETILKAFVIGRDPQTDIALLKVKTDQQLTPVLWADSNSVQVGDWVLAAGNPFGLGPTVSAGIISARSRDLSFGAYDDFLQTDAAVHQGNSGGPLFNLEGRVIGMNTALFAPKGENMGLNFAIPSNTILWIKDALLKEGVVRRGKLGLTIQNVPEDVRQTLNLSPTAGAYVAQVDIDGPAHQAGLQKGDVIVSVNQIPITQTKMVSRLTAQLPIGQTIPIDIYRGQTRHTLTLIVAEKEILPLSEPKEEAHAH